jgi:hypothetical protein
LSQKKLYSSFNEHARLLVEAQNIERARLLADKAIADKAIVDKTIADRRAQITANVAKARLAESTAAQITADKIRKLKFPDIFQGKDIRFYKEVFKRK